MRKSFAIKRSCRLIVMAAVFAAMGCQQAGPEPALVSIPRIREAKALALTYDGRVHVVWAGGEAMGRGEMTGPEMTERYGFTAVAYDPLGIDMRSWDLLFEGGWSVTPVFPPLGITIAIDLCDVEMDVSYAWWLVLRSSLASSFYHWELFQPLTPGAEHPVFIFATAIGYVIVDTVTSAVSVESLSGALSTTVTEPAWAARSGRVRP